MCSFKSFLVIFGVSLTLNASAMAITVKLSSGISSHPFVDMISANATGLPLLPL